MAPDIDQSEWDGVYYDRQTGDFVITNVSDDGIEHIDAITGHSLEEFTAEEFTDNVAGDLTEVSPEVVRDPTSTVEALLAQASNAVSGDRSGFTQYDPVDVDFAITATNLSHDNDAPYTR